MSGDGNNNQNQQNQKQKGGGGGAPQGFQFGTGFSPANLKTPTSVKETMFVVFIGGTALILSGLAAGALALYLGPKAGLPGFKEGNDAPAQGGGQQGGGDWNPRKIAGRFAHELRTNPELRAELVAKHGDVFVDPNASDDDDDSGSDEGDGENANA